jgi:predicted ABC-type ATPase
LSPFSHDAAAIRAGKVMLQAIRDHVANRDSFAFETTLSGRRYARLIPVWQAEGYAVKLVFLYLNSVDTAIARVAARAAHGGHNIPETTIRRRYEAGWHNFNEVYKPLVDAWGLYDNSGSGPRLLLEGES